MLFFMQACKKEMLINPSFLIIKQSILYRLPITALNFFLNFMIKPFPEFKYWRRFCDVELYLCKRLFIGNNKGSIKRMEDDIAW